MKIITIDAGKFQTKGILDDKRINFRTKIEEIDNSIKLNDDLSFYMKWQNKYYLIGEGAKFIDYEANKHKLQHQLTTYIACNQLLQGEINKTFNLVVLSPLSMYTNKEERESFRQFIFNGGKINFELNGNEIELNINDAIVFAEACGIPLNNISKFKDKIVGILDIGGLNVNGIIIKNMKPVKDTEFTINAGSLLIMEKIRKELNKSINGANIQEYQMDQIIKQGYYQGDIETSKEIMQSILSSHFKEIIQVAKGTNWDIKGLDIAIAGGGSLDLGIDNIRKYIPQAELSKDPIWDSCIGGSKVGEIIYE